MYKMIATLILSLFTSVLTAPPNQSAVIIAPEPVRPYEAIWNATCFLESSNDSLAYHLEENGFASVGIAQIQNSRIIDFNARTGHNYTLVDMYQPSKAKIVFMHYASEINPNDLERISRLWNGGPSGMSKKSTVEYWLLIQKAL